MKILSLLTGLILLGGSVLAQTSMDCENPIPGASCYPTPPLGNNNPEDGNGALGVFYSNTACGLNYVQASQQTTTRYAGSPGTGLPTNLSITGIPPCATVIQAFMFWSGGGTANNANYTFNGNPGVGARIGNHGSKCWGTGGTEAYRADVTANVTGNGVYTFSHPIGNDIDGATLLVIYTDPNATYEGAIRLADGCISSATTPSNQTLTGMNVCANTVNGRAFVINSDMQNNVAATHTCTMNGVGPQAFPNDFYNWDEIATNFTAGQTTCAFEVAPTGGDCYLWSLMGVYYQTTTCVVCVPPPGLNINSNTTLATCNVCDGTATANPSGGTAPYTYSWNTVPVQTTQTASGLCPGQYIVTVTDASGCLTAMDTVTVTEAPCACNMDSLFMNIGPCNANNTYDLTGTIYFSNAPTTGTLTITDNCSGLDTTIFPPFVSPQTWGIYNNPTGTGNCSVTAVFSADPLCTISSNSYPQTAPCPCTANIGTFTPTVIGNSNSVDKLCFGDQFTLTSNGNNIDPLQANNPAPPAPYGYNPGIGYLIYSCPPTVFPQNPIWDPITGLPNDPCVVGVVGFGNSFNDLNALGIPSYAGPWNNNTIYYVPITFYDTINGLYSYTNTSTNCYDMGTPFAVQYLPEITYVEVPDCQDSSVTVTISGGLPELDGSLYTASNLQPANASFVNNTCTHGGTIKINGLQNGDMYSFDVVDTNGCPVTINGGPFVALPITNANLDDTSCTLTYNLNAIASYGAGQWSGPLGVVFAPSTSPTATVTVPTAGSYSFIWSEDNGNGCISYDTVDILFVEVSIPNTPTDPACKNGTDGQIILAPQGGIAPYSYAWGPNANNQTTNPATNLGAGSYTVRVTDAFGCFVDSTFTLTEPAGFTFTTDSVNSNCGLPDGSVSILNLTGGTPAYTYDWGAGPTANNTLNNLAPGTYTVVIADQNNCDTTVSITVINNPTFTASITGFTNALCFGGASGTATADGSDPLATYNFSWNTVPVQNTQTATGLTAGTYTCTVTDAATGCTDTATVTIGEPSQLTVNAGNDAIICTGGNTNISAVAAGGTPVYSYSWNNGLGAGQNHNVSPAVLTSYIVTVTDANGCTAMDTVDVDVHPPLTVMASADDSICPGGQATISAQAGIGSGNGGPYTYTWNNGVGIGQSHSVSPLTTTTYVVTLTDGCSPAVIDSVTIYINPLPQVDFVADTLSLCESPQMPFEFYNITNPAGGMVGTTSWNFGDGSTGSGDTVSHTYAAPGTYDITLTVTSTPGAGGCTNSLTKTNYVQVYANPTAEFTMNPNPVSMFDPTVYFIDQSYWNIVAWNWNIGGFEQSTLQNPTYTFPDDTGSYPVTLIVTDANGCMAEITNTVIVRGEYGVWVPNAFTPDFDGVNDGFFPNGFGIIDNNYNFYIFNRWGELIFESHNKFEPWDGTYKGKLVQNGTYVWRLEFQDINGQNHSKVGHVNVIK